MNIATALTRATARLAGDSARLDAEVLLSHCLGKPRSHLFAWPEQALPAETERCFETLIERRLAGHPIAHLTGSREFWSLPLAVTPDVLIPRPETELLVETALRRLRHPRARVADLGTGSGAIAIALASERRDWHLIATDRSPKALDIARANALHFALTNLEFHLGDWCSALPLDDFDLIVSNPPYIPARDPHLLQGDLRFEQRTALVSGPDGLDDIRQIARCARKHLKPGAWLMLEHGYNQAQAVTELLTALNYTAIETLDDLAGQPRLTLGQTMRAEP